jgi:hypothetical protein
MFTAQEIEAAYVALVTTELLPMLKNWLTTPKGREIVGALPPNASRDEIANALRPHFNLTGNISFRTGDGGAAFGSGPGGNGGSMQIGFPPGT